MVFSSVIVCCLHFLLQLQNASTWSIYVCKLPNQRIEGHHIQPTYDIFHCIANRISEAYVDLERFKMPIKRLVGRTAVVSFALASVLLVLLLVGCAGESTTSSSSEQEQTQQTVVDEPIRIGAMKGPTAIGLADMIKQDGPEYSFDIVTAADELVPKLASGDLDIALIPANLAATLYNKNGGIEVIDVNTMGVLYAVTGDEELASSDDVQVADLIGRTIYMTGKGTVPEYTLKYLLSEAGVGEGDVNIEFRSEPSEVAALISADPSSVGILPQPFATSATIQNDSLHSVMDLTEQWDAMADGSEAAVEAQSEAGSGGVDDADSDAGRLVTGVTVVRSEFFENNPELVELFLNAHAESVSSVNDDPTAYADLLVELGIIGNATVAETAIPLCNVVCLTGDDMKDALAGYLGVLMAYSPESVGGALPEDDFYYIETR